MDGKVGNKPHQLTKHNGIKERTMNGRECQEEENKHTCKGPLGTGPCMLICKMTPHTFIKTSSDLLTVFFDDLAVFTLGYIRNETGAECKTPSHNARMTSRVCVVKHSDILHWRGKTW